MATHKLTPWSNDKVQMFTNGLAASILLSWCSQLLCAIMTSPTLIAIKNDRSRVEQSQVEQSQVGASEKKNPNLTYFQIIFIL